jgi:tetratricopeptide (TPR) repeat protein
MRLSVVGVCGFLLFTSTSARSRPVPEDALQKGTALLKSGDYLEAAAEFDRLKQTAPEDPQPYFYAGTAWAQAGLLNDASAELSEAVRLAPERLEYRVFQAHVLTQLDQKVTAQDTLAIFKDSGKLDQLSSAWLRLLADVYYRLQLIPETLTVLDVWGRRDPNDARIDLDRGQAYVVKGDAVSALKSFQASINKSSNNPQAYFELGKILYQRNDLAGAKAALQAAVKQDPTNPEFLYRLALVDLALKQTDEALEHLRRAEPAAAALPEINLALARALRARGDTAQAADYMKRFERAEVTQREQKSRLQTVDRYIARGERLLDQGNAAEAQPLFEQALAIDPNRWAPHAYLAEMLLSAGDLGRAYQHLTKMQELDPNSVIGNYQIATYWWKSNDYARARMYAEKAKLSRPDNSELRHLLGDIYLGLGQKEKAIEEYKAAVRLAPDRADFRAQLQKLLSTKSASESR